MLIKRMLVTGWKNFARGGAVSVATVLIMTVTLAIISSLIFLSALLSYTLTAVKNKVDISVYFVTTASELEVLAVKDQLEQLPQVVEVTYSSAEQVLTEFRARHENDRITLQALEEVGDNPFGASLGVRATDPSQYESIVNYLKASPVLSAAGTSIIDSINYERNPNVKKAVDSISLWTNVIRDVGIVVIVFFAIASVLIAFATIQLTIYTAKDEIAVMRLVGASNAYIQGPFIVTGVITGLIAALLVLLLLLPATWYVGENMTWWLDGFNAAQYYSDNLAFILVVIVCSGVTLGAAASVLAIRKYLTV